MEIDYLFGDDPRMTTSQQTFPESSSAWRNNNFNTYLSSPRLSKSPRDFVAPVNPSVQQKKSHTPTKGNISHQQFSQLGVPMRPMCPQPKLVKHMLIGTSAVQSFTPRGQWWYHWVESHAATHLDGIGWEQFHGVPLGGGFKKNNDGSCTVPVFEKNQKSTRLG